MTDIGKAIETILIKYGHYHDKMADELLSLLEEEVSKARMSEYNLMLDNVHFSNESLDYIQDRVKSLSQEKNEEYPSYGDSGIEDCQPDISIDISKVDRFEVIDDTGRAYVKGSIYGTPISVELSFQDDSRTLKVFVDKREVK